MQMRHAGPRRTRTNAPYVQKVVWLAFAELNVHPALRTYFFEDWLQTDTIQLFTECSLHKRMLFLAPRLHVHINISHISSCLIGVRIAFVYRCGPGFIIQQSARLYKLSNFIWMVYVRSVYFAVYAVCLPVSSVYLRVYIVYLVI